MKKIDHCPICKCKIDSREKEAGAYFPFCSQRCQLVDLGKWFDGEYTIAVEDSEDDS